MSPKELIRQVIIVYFVSYLLEYAMLVYLVRCLPYALPRNEARLNAVNYVDGAICYVYRGWEFNLIHIAQHQLFGAAILLLLKMVYIVDSYRKNEPMNSL